MKRIFILTTLFVFSFTQAKAICMNDDDLIDYAIVSYMETTWATMEACIESVPNFDYTIYDKFFNQFQKVNKTSNGYVDAYFKTLYGTDIIAKKKKKENIELIVNDYKANVINKIEIKELCERLNYSSQKYIDNDLQVFLDDIAATYAREARTLMPKCDEEEKEIEKKEVKKKIKEAMENLKIKLICQAFGDGYVFDKNGKIISHYINDGDRKESIEVLAVEDDNSFEVFGVLEFMDFIFKITTMNEKTIRAEHVDYGHVIKIDRITGVMESRLIGQNDGTQFTDDWNCKKAEKQF